MPVDFLAFGYATLVAAGGIMGYLHVKNGSLYSLGMGVIYGSLLGYGAYQTSLNPDNYLISLGTSAVVAAVMANRCYTAGKFMPAGLVTTLSVLMVIRYSARAI